MLLLSVCRRLEDSKTLVSALALRQSPPLIRRMDTRLQIVRRTTTLLCLIMLDSFEFAHDSFSLIAAAMSSFLFDALFWGILSWYSNRVARAEYGRPLSWYFPFTLSYWCPGRIQGPMEEESKVKYAPDIPVEPVSGAMKEQVARGKGIEIRNLTKTFGDKTAVNRLSMDMFSDQITCLLGHNGAGKTTTISMLTGMVDPTSGYAKVTGKDIRTEMESIREGIGICLQHDCLFPELTVREHVSFFARIKGLYTKVSRAEAERKIDTSIRDVALGEKRNTLSKNLSGGMKRKLSVAIAFCGDRYVSLYPIPLFSIPRHTSDLPFSSLLVQLFFWTSPPVAWIRSRDDSRGMCFENIARIGQSS